MAAVVKKSYHGNGSVGWSMHRRWVVNRMWSCGTRVIRIVLFLTARSVEDGGEGIVDLTWLALVIEIWLRQVSSCFIR